METTASAKRRETSKGAALKRKWKKKRNTKRRRDTSDIINDFTVIISVFTDVESLVHPSSYYRVYSRFEYNGSCEKFCSLPRHRSYVVHIFRNHFSFTQQFSTTLHLQNSRKGKHT